MFVALSDEWERRALAGGEGRQGYADGAGLRDHGEQQLAPDEGTAIHIVGCRAECAVAKVLRLPWIPNVGVITATDVGGKVEVRARRIPGRGTDLARRPKDKDEFPYVLCHVHGNTFGRIELKGWLFGLETRTRGGMWVASHRVWFIPPPYRTIESLIERFRK